MLPSLFLIVPAFFSKIKFPGESLMNQWGCHGLVYAETDM